MDQSENHSQLIQPQNTYKRFKRSVIRCLQRLGCHSATPPMSTNVLTSEDHPALLSGQGRLPFATANTGTHRSHPQSRDHNAPYRHDPHHSETASAEDCNTESAINPVATQFQGAHGFNITGNPTMINAGMNKGKIDVTNVNNYGGVHGLEKMEKMISFNAQFDSQVQDPESQCHPGTRETVLAQMRDWIDNLDATEPIFWLCGAAGAGKSAIARTLALSCGRPKITATFFFYRSDDSRNDGNLLFPTLAYQLSISIPAIKDLVAKSLNERPDLSMTAIETQFEELIVRPLQALNVAALPAPAIVIIDGVDECTDEKLQRRFLVLICTAVRHNRIPLRFIISSRREAHIEDTINRTRCPKICLDLSDLNAGSDIKAYLTDKLSDIASSQGLDPKVWPGSRKMEELVLRASGQFAYASLVIRYAGDEDFSAKTQLDIILGLRSPTTTSPFKHLDELYLKILQRHPDQDFLTNFLTLFLTFLRIGSNFGDLHKDYSLLMNVSEEEFHIKLRKLRSVFKFEPDIDVHHRSFLEFLQGPSRSGQYHIKEVAARRYLELITQSLVRYVTEDPHNNRHEVCHFRPEFGMLVHAVPLKVLLAVNGWQEVLQPLLIVWNNLPNFSPDSNFLSCDECTGFRIIRYLLFNVMFFEETFDHICPSSMSNTHKASRPVTFFPPLVPEAGGNTLEQGLKGCLTSLLTHHRKDEVRYPTIGYLTTFKQRTVRIINDSRSPASALTL
ncbi:hypothetical protein M378DRAFT_174292 [Amanita muscaria Koide BX008]|uniref:Nephrocystin 3-like N-terminal domain-containing protein n=1 Tax=Amanita muscaria (strain Koide BX008) TaxID=946122 RepID=A0A0C2WE85_AMAMK|nr:hypothetical protein M378DRAFT_174292 [Amanita muscaria Koide BX008]